MSADTDDAAGGPLSPDEAFALLGNETRMGILQTLAEAEAPVSFSELRDRIGVADSGRFNYHLGKLEAHFIAKTEAGYRLRQPGRWIVGAVLSGAVTADPTLDRTPVDFDCLFCGTPIEVSYRSGRVALYCTGCSGTFGASGVAETGRAASPGYLGSMELPPAGVQGRTPEALLDAASIWGHLDILAAANGVCPLCSGAVSQRPDVCADHDADDGLCPNCDRRHAVQADRRCANCHYRQVGPFVTRLFADLRLRLFIGKHGIDPIVDGLRWGWEYEEEVLSVDPFAARFTFTIDGDAIELTVDDELAVTEVIES